ncbi:MAG: hypothetical protein JNL05_00485 [Flavobacteriales bacterium]|nr:hypothetical protein [Flavobacteriales bacterium]
MAAQHQRTFILLLWLKQWAEPELRRSNRLLKQANDQLDHALRENTTLKNRNEELKRHVERLEIDNRELHNAMDRLREANRLQSETIDRMDKFQRELAGRIEYLVGRVVQLDAERGIVTKLPWNER